MKRTIFLALIGATCMASCMKEGPYTQGINTSINEANSILVRRGAFIPTSGIEVTGFAEIRQAMDARYVKFVDFTISEGPDLKVYLSKNDFPSEFINLGSLQASDVPYAIPNGIDVTEYPYVLIHCQQYDHLFAISNPIE